MLPQSSWRRLRLLSPNGPFPKDGRCGLVGQSNRQCYRLRWWRKSNQTPRLYCWHRSSSYRSPVPAARSDHSELQPLSRPRMAITKVRLATLDEADWSKCPLGPELCPSNIVQGAPGRKLRFVWMVRLSFGRLGRRMAKCPRQFAPPVLVQRMSPRSEQELVSD